MSKKKLKLKKKELKTYKKLRNYGLRLDPITPDNYLGGVFSNVPFEEIMPSGQWDEFLPVAEYQAFNLVESQGCVSFGTLNCIEILLKRLYNE